MKVAIVFVAILAAASAARLHQTGSPVTKVVSLLGELKAKIESDGKMEQESYDKFACWCEDTLARKANDIATAKERIEELGQLIVKLKADIASLGAEIEQLKKDIAANIESQKEATEVREKESGEFEVEKTEGEQCIGALEAAIKVLTGAGTGKKGFLETLQETQVLSVVDGIRRTIKKPLVADTVPDDQLQIVRHFVDRPEDFLGNRAGVMSAAQIAQNPFGDYAPQSTQIQGILKGMYDAFAGNLEKDNADEAEKQKAYEELMKTKQTELTTLQATLTTQTADKAGKTKQLADSKAELDDTKVQLEADEKFFAETKASCSTKASEWSNRCRLRTMELQGVHQAIDILSGGLDTFNASATTLLQVAKGQHGAVGVARKRAFNSLSNIATKYRNMAMAQLAVAVKTGGHFDKIIAMIDEMITVLRKEEADDIAHRDRCEAGVNKNANDMEDLNSEMEKTDGELSRMNNTQKELTGKVAEQEEAITETKKSLTDLQDMRNTEEDEFKQALKDDADAVELLEQAIVALTRFYKENKIPLSLRQKQEPEYTVDPDVAPETTWTGGNYGGRKGESEGIIAILSMIKEDTENEMKVAREEDAEAQKDYLEQRKTLEETLQAQKDTKLATEKALADVNGKMLDAEEYKEQKGADLAGQKELEGTLETDCEWVKTHFDTRREKRKAEIDGLVEAKGFLAGVESGTDDDLSYQS